MRKDNPATQECPRGTGGIHHWRRLPDGQAQCLNCRLRLSKADADDVWTGEGELAVTFNQWLRERSLRAETSTCGRALPEASTAVQSEGQLAEVLATLGHGRRTAAWLWATYRAAWRRAQKINQKYFPRPT